MSVIEFSEVEKELQRIAHALGYPADWECELSLQRLRRLVQNDSQHVADVTGPPTLMGRVGGIPIMKINDGKRR